MASSKRTSMEASCIPEPEYKQRFNNAIQSMLSVQEESGFPPILKTINRRLKQYQLQGRVSPYEVFNEACDRALAKFERCEEIPNIPGWLTTTCCYIISELSRKFRRNDGMTLEYPDDDQDSGKDQEFTRYDPNCLNRLDLLAMYELFDKLSALDKKILRLYVSGLSWEEVADHLIESGEQSGDRRRVVQSIAQRASRARRRLYDQYFD